MWTRAELKHRAKNALTDNFWKAFVAGFVISVAENGVSGFQYRGNNESFSKLFSSGGTHAAGSETSIAIWAAMIVFILILVSLAIALRVFVGMPLEVGGRRYFARLARQEGDLNNLIYSFKEGRYIPIVKTMFRMGLMVFLWSLLLIIPGIVKGYAYRMVPYILGDNPTLAPRRALEISEAMTDGEKMNMWVLDLSFIGWFLLGLLGCIVGILFVFPYFEATRAELYLVLKQRALEKGLCTAEELGITADPFAPTT